MKIEIVTRLEEQCDKCHRPATHVYNYFWAVLWFYRQRMYYLCTEHAKEIRRRE